MPSTTTPRSVMRSTPSAVGVDERDVRAVERVEVLVVEARPLAELAVVRLQRLGRVRVVDDRVDAGADLLHLLEVGELDRLGQAARRRVDRCRPRASAPAACR